MRTFECGNARFAGIDVQRAISVLILQTDLKLLVVTSIGGNLGSI
jgi:hypothetical protein